MTDLEYDKRGLVDFFIALASFIVRLDGCETSPIATRIDIVSSIAGYRESVGKQVVDQIADELEQLEVTTCECLVLKKTSTRGVSSRRPFQL
jgi:hypothetical protein